MGKREFSRLDVNAGNATIAYFIEQLDIEIKTAI